VGEHTQEHRHVRGFGLALAHHIEGSDICANWRHRCGADHIAAGADWWFSQLGLPRVGGLQDFSEGWDFSVPCFPTSKGSGRLRTTAATAPINKRPLRRGEVTPQS
jgi:hypothetical protein